MKLSGRNWIITETFIWVPEKLKTELTRRSEEAGEFCYCVDRIVGIRNLSETIGRIDKRDACFMGGFKIPQGITHIYGGFQVVLPDDRTDVGSFGFAGITGTEMTGEIVAESGGFQKAFDISGLAVADDIERITL